MGVGEWKAEKGHNEQVTAATAGLTATEMAERTPQASHQRGEKVAHHRLKSTPREADFPTISRSPSSQRKHPERATDIGMGSA